LNAQNFCPFQLARGDNRNYVQQLRFPWIITSRRTKPEVAGHEVWTTYSIEITEKLVVWKQRGVLCANNNVECARHGMPMSEPLNYIVT